MLAAIDIHKAVFQAAVFDPADGAITEPPCEPRADSAPTTAPTSSSVTPKHAAIHRPNATAARDPPQRVQRATQIRRNYQSRPKTVRPLTT